MRTEGKYWLAKLKNSWVAKPSPFHLLAHHLHSHCQTSQVVVVAIALQGSSWSASKHLLFSLKFSWKSPYKVSLNKSASTFVILSRGSDCVQKQPSIFLCLSPCIEESSLLKSRPITRPLYFYWNRNYVGKDQSLFIQGRENILLWLRHKAAGYIHLNVMLPRCL